MLRVFKDFSETGESPDSAADVSSNTFQFREFRGNVKSQVWSPLFHRIKKTASSFS